MDSTALSYTDSLEEKQSGSSSVPVPFLFSVILDALAFRGV